MCEGLWLSVDLKSLRPSLFVKFSGTVFNITPLYLNYCNLSLPKECSYKFLSQNQDEQVNCLN